MKGAGGVHAEGLARISCPGFGFAGGEGGEGTVREERSRRGK